MGPAPIAELRRRWRGELITPDDPTYDTARRVWNGMIDRHPALIARCVDARDVAAAIAFARQRDLVVAVRGGGHNVGGTGTCDGGLVIDLGAMRAVSVDPVARRARVQGGARWGETDRATQRHDLATTGGEVSTTGVSGLTLGGGLGWLMGKCGLACDNLIGAQVVSADGRILRAAPDEHADLLWALRGGGGNFGVVTELELALAPVGPVLAGLILFPISQAEAFLRFYRDWTATAPDELTAMGALLVTGDGAPAVGAIVCCCGDLGQGQRLLDPLRSFGRPLLDSIGPMAYVDLQSMLDASAPAGRRNYWKAAFAPKLSDALISSLVGEALPLLSPFSSILIEHLHGAAARVPSDATAFGVRGEQYSIGIFSVWEDAVADERHVAWARRVRAGLVPHVLPGAYSNYLGPDETSQALASYGGNQIRLRKLKAKYDPDNVFRLNHNIVPDGSGGEC